MKSGLEGKYAYIANEPYIGKMINNYVDWKKKNVFLQEALPLKVETIMKGATSRDHSTEGMYFKI